MNREHMVESMSIIAAAFRLEVSELWLLAYWDALEDLDDAAMDRARKIALRERKEFAPSPAMMRSYALRRVQCRCCGLGLTEPDSIASGTCKAHRDALPPPESDIKDLNPPFDALRDALDEEEEVV